MIDGKYRVDCVMGRGGMGVVFSAYHVDLARNVALKFLCFEESAGIQDDSRARFRREAQISARLRNEHITRVLDVGSWQGSAYIVLERLEGGDLRRTLKVHGGKLPLQMALNYTLQICEGMAEAHAHDIVHRDLKPANLFVTRRPDGSDFIKIMDFGISKWRDSEIGEATKEGIVLGSPKYMAPEQIFGRKTDARADVWSIGAILYEMLGGRTPYTETSLARFCAALLAGPPPPLDVVNPEIPPRVAAVVARCFEQDPDRRIRSVADLAGELLDAVDSPPNTLRERLTAIIERRTVDEISPNSSQRMLLNVAAAPVSGVTRAPESLVSSSHTMVSSGVSSPPQETRSSKAAPLIGVALVALVAGGFGVSRMLGGAAPGTESVRAALSATPSTASQAPAPAALSAVIPATSSPAPPTAAPPSADATVPASAPAPPAANGTRAPTPRTGGGRATGSPASPTTPSRTKTADDDIPTRR
jgi:serine/threonine-protein kinase